MGGKGIPLPVEALKILAEFAGAQLDRLMALSGGVPAEAAAQAQPVEVEPIETEPERPQRSEQRAEAGVTSGAPATERTPAPSHATSPSAGAAAPVGAAQIDLSQLNEADRKAHQDAKRFARLLVSEIDLYNKAKVADGRKEKNLYEVLKTDIERSRQTYEKRFGKTVAKQVDYFHEELIRTLAKNDPSLLGASYPGPSV